LLRRQDVAVFQRPCSTSTGRANSDRMVCMIAGMAFLRAGRYLETVGWQCKLAVWVTEICLVRAR
jgi:hypothetical protein